jgi:hypothetical protein
VDDGMSKAFEGFDYSEAETCDSSFRGLRVYSRLIVASQAGAPCSSWNLV